MKFNNHPNKSYQFIENGNKKLVWESRSVAVNCVVVLKNKNNDIFVLVSKRGPNAADYHGKLNLIAGYLDWDESGTDAVYREAWEECGINLKELQNRIFSKVIRNDLKQPWNVKTEPDENRQNISLRYGVFIEYNSTQLPHLSLDHNEVEGEVEKAWWMPISDINNYEWAFSHNQVIFDYLNLIIK